MRLLRFMDHLPSLEERVIRFTAQHWPPRKGCEIKPDTRLSQDLGIEGDDAIEFFEEFEREFGVDITDLHLHWSQHFAPEGSLSLGVMVVLVFCVTAGFWLRDLVGIFPAWAWGLTLIAIAIMIHQWLAEDMQIPITVGDLIKSVRSGRWEMSYFGSF